MTDPKDKVKAFMAATPPAKNRRGKLWKFKDSIMELREKGYTNAQIIEFLWIYHELEVTPGAMSQFVNAHPDIKNAGKDME